MRVFIPRFLGAIAYLVVLTVVGAVGYIVIEGWPWQEALYMTVITITAVGFQEVRPLSELGRDFTMVILAAGVFVCLSARDLNPDLTIVARALEEGSVEKLYRAGANHVVSPNVSGAIKMASMLLRPEVVSFLDVVTRSEGLELRFEQAVVQPDYKLAGLTLIEARIP